MTQLDDRLRAGLSALVEDVAPTRTPDEVIEDLRGRPTLLETASPSGPSRRRTRRLVLAVACLALVVVAGALVVTRDGPSEPTRVDVTPDPTTPEPGDPASLGGGWHDLPPGPFDGVDPTGMVWTGAELVLWHGEHYDDGTQTDDAATYDPVSGVWRGTGPDPLVGRGIKEGGGAWTGTEALFWSDLGVVLWNPTTRSWREAAPPTERMSNEAAWDGERLLMWSVGLAYDPSADTWSSIPLPAGPDIVPGGGAVAVWTGSELIVVEGSANHSFDPSTGEWTELGPFDLEGWDQVTASGVVVGDELWVISGCCGSPSGRALSLGDRTWRTLTDDEVPPLQSSEGTPTLTWLGDPDDGGVLYAAHGGVQSRLVDGAWTEPEVTYWSSSWAVVDGALVVPSQVRMKIYVPPEGVDAGTGADAVAAGTWGEVGRLPVTFSYPRVVAADDEVYVWDGAAQGESDTAGAGYAFDPDTGAWGGVPALPDDEHQVQLGLWSDRRVVGWAEGGVWSWAPGDAAWALDAFPGEGPMQTVYQRQPIWTGEELYFWADGWAYRPRDRAWTRIAPMPSVPTRAWSAWTGNAGYVVGLASDAVPGLTVALLYDPGADRWTQTEAPGVDGSWLGLATMGSFEVVAVDTSGDAAQTTAAAATWDPLPRVPFGPSSDWLLASHLPRSVLVTAEGGGGWLLSDGDWAPVPGTPEEVRATEPWRDGLLGVSADGRIWWYRSLP